MIDKIRFTELLVVKLAERDIKATLEEVEQEDNIIKGMVRPTQIDYWFAFKDDVEEDMTEAAAERAAYQMENQIHPERIERKLLEAAMEVLNGRPKEVNSEV